MAAILFGTGGRKIAVYGYHRTSTTDQHLDRGVYEIEHFCEEQKIELTEIYTDQQTGKNLNRPEYQFIRKRIMPGDTLIITELDRLSRRKADILAELQYFQEKRVRVMILEIPTTLMNLNDLDNAMAQLIIESINNLLIEMYAIFAQAELEKKEKRQREGIAAKKLRGDWNDYGRPRNVGFATFAAGYAKVLRGELRPSELQRQLKLPPTTYYRYAEEYRKQKK